MNIDLAPTDLDGLHEPRDQQLLISLERDMRRDGWSGRPLLVFEDDDGYVAWTGCHRIAAAIYAELSTVPCYVLDAAQLVPLGVSAGEGHASDHDRLEIIRQLGDDDAIQIMWAETQLC